MSTKSKKRTQRKIAIILGTRPEIIKMTPVIRALEGKGADYYILHTGQHYSYNLDRIFFEQLKLPDARYNIDAGSGSHAEQTAKILVGVEEVLLKDRPDVVLVEGDTNSVLAGALAATKLHVQVGHVEAGLRSYDRQMPEEINRILADRCSDYLFAPTKKAKSILLHEGIPKSKIFVTGNTIVDAVYQNLEIARRSPNRNFRPITSHVEHRALNLEPRTYFLVTLHRQENVDNSTRLKGILQGLELVASEFSLPVIYPIHPRAAKMMRQFRLKPKNIELVEPLDFLAFLQLESNARLLLTDSGGVQEEACILKVPCVTLRDNTERPETINVGANVLAGATPNKILECTRLMLQRSTKWKNPFGDGKAGQRIVEIVT
ncbi:MAG: UDP-N-acetylglucosamine 2-epimerase (non-hydrolyzing) [Chloroflexi bacterium]|nr:UDP-N-acetylglucosamine 2-epimerase (non-hydrolyzing) [Chloroflexota bacterium]